MTVHIEWSWHCTGAPTPGATCPAHGEGPTSARDAEKHAAKAGHGAVVRGVPA